MLLTEARLRALIHDILLEGVREDAAALEVDLEDNPAALSQLRSLTTKPKWVNWLADRYLRQKYPVDDTLPDVLPLVVNFASKDAAIGTKYGSNEQFKAAVDAAFGPPSTRGWQNPSDATKMSASDLNTLLVLHNRKKQRLEVDRADESWKQDKIGQFGPWALYFPTSQQNSVNIAGADPVTLKGYTTWCTARTGGSNLFYNYAGHGTMLFYAIDESKPPTDPKGRISLGYVRGKLNASGEHGGVTVDAKNSGLKMPNLRRIFGSHLSGILAAAEAVVKHHGAEHPAKAEIAAARQDVMKFKSMLSGLSDDEAGDLCRLSILGAVDVSSEVVLAAASHKSAGVRLCVAGRRATPLHIVEKLASDPDASVRATVASHHRIPPHVLEKLAGDASASVRANVIWHPSATAHLLEKLAADADVGVRATVASHLDAPSHVLEKLASDTEERVRVAVASHYRIPPHVLEKLAGDTVERVRRIVAAHKSTPRHVHEKLVDDTSAYVRRGAVYRAPSHALEKLAADSDEVVRMSVVHNSETPPHLLEKLSADTAVEVRVAVLYNKKTPIHVREKLVSDPNRRVSRLAGSQVARSRKASPEVLEQLSSSGFVTITRAVARNPKTPLTALRSLAQHKDKKTRETAQATLAKLQPMGEARRLAHRIIAELKRR